MKMITLETERLILRPFTQSDLQNLIDLDRDPEVMKYLGPLTPFEEIQRTLDWLIERQSRIHEYGTWMTDLKETGENIGWFTFKPVPGLQNEFDVGYRLKHKFWGRGYATEGTQFLLRYGFEKLKLPKIMATAHLENNASQHVLLKNGLKRLANIPNFYRNNGTELAVFEILNPAIQS